MFCLPIDWLSIIFSQSWSHINFWQYNWRLMQEHIVYSPAEEIGSSLSGCKYPLGMSTCLLWSALSGAERVLGHTGTRFAVGKISSWDKGWGPPWDVPWKKRSDLAIKSLKRVVSMTLTMGYSEEHLVGRKGMFKHKSSRGFGTECNSSSRDTDWTSVRRLQKQSPAFRDPRDGGD